VKKQYFFSFVLAALSFVAAKSLEEVGVERYYFEKASNFQKEDGYFDLTTPESISNLPMGVMPFSDVTPFDSTHLACIYSESGEVAFFDFTTNTVSLNLALGSKYKFIDVSKIDSTLILLDSESQVHFLNPPYDSTSFVNSEFLKENFTTSGICLHPSTKRLFLLGEMQEQETGIFAAPLFSFNLNKNKFKEVPLFEVNSSAIESFAYSNNLVLPFSKIDAKGDTVQGIDFVPSAIAIHPKTNEIYILSSKDNSLVVYNQFGSIVNYTVLDKSIFNRPTAMTFQENGDLLITNSSLMHPSIVKLKWNKLFQTMSHQGLIFGK